MSIRAVFAPPPALVAVMDAQHGLFTTSQGRAAGYTPDELQRLRSRRALLSVRRGVYAAAADYRQLEPLERHRVDTQAALLRLASPAALSHETAAVWTGMSMLKPSLQLLHVTRPELPASHVHAGIHHHPGALPDEHLTVVGNARITSPARTAVDIARNVDFARGLAVADSCLRSGVSRGVLQDAMAFCASWPGARGASRAVSWADGRADNPGESYSRAVLIEQGLPPSDIQFPVRDEHGLVGLADFVWLDQWTLGEFDGRLKYAPGPDGGVEAAARVLWLEKQREDRLRAAGFEVVRWTWQDLLRPAELVARILAAFARAAARRRTAN
jgi:hypothetical protein